MAEPLRIKVDKDVYQKTLDSLKLKLADLNGYRENLEKEIENLKSGEVYRGSDVQPAIDKAEQLLERVKDGISTVVSYQIAVENELNGITTAASNLQTSMNDIDVPNLFG